MFSKDYALHFKKVFSAFEFRDLKIITGVETNIYPLTKLMNFKRVHDKGSLGGC